MWRDKKSKYDHHQKAGNLGDVFKHVALIAAVDKVVAGMPHSPFKYADVFAGYAMNPLIPEQGQWEKGIGMIAGDSFTNDNPHVAFWAEHWSDEKGAVAGSYPGSSFLAKKVCDHQRKKIEMWLWDTEPGPIADLKKHFPAHKGHIFQRAANPNDLGIKNADFVFIDPPDKKHWRAIRDVVEHLERPPKQSVLIWLPICANTRFTPPIEDGKSTQCREESRRLGMSATTVRWARGGHMIGCQLLYRVNPRGQQALRKAVEDLFECTGFPSDDVLGVRHFDS